MSSDPENLSFFRDIESFSEFSEIIDDSHYHPVPSGWCIVVADVKSSTKAIEEGRYKDVNTVGAAAIAVVQNALGEMEIPYVFGGDGSTLIIPVSQRQTVTSKLAALKTLARDNYDLELIIGIVDTAEILANGHTIDVGKLELESGKCVAIFRGGGLTHAEKLVKGLPDKYQIPCGDPRGADLAGLSCRWNAIPNKNGCILSLLVAARGDRKNRVYADLLRKIEETLSLEDSNPVNPSLMSYRSVADLAKDEKRLHPKRSFRWIARFFEIIAAVLIFKWKIPPLFFNPRRYVESMRTHSDYRKFDDMLRMIVDCTHDQFEQLSDYLEGAHDRGDLFYGLLRSDTSLMTCYFKGTGDGNHIHFIDGGNGGYALASKQFKAQQKEADSATTASSGLES